MEGFADAGKVRNPPFVAEVFAAAARTNRPQRTAGRSVPPNFIRRECDKMDECLVWWSFTAARGYEANDHSGPSLTAARRPHRDQELISVRRGGGGGDAQEDRNMRVRCMPPSARRPVGYQHNRRNQFRCQAFLEHGIEL